MSANRVEFKGCYTAIVTPLSPDGRTVDTARLAEHVRFQAEGGVTGIVPCGTTGESPTLTEAEHISVVETAIKVGRPLGLQVIAGAGSNNTAHAVHLQKLAHKLGADAGLQVTPYYNKPSQEGMLRHIELISSAMDVPIMIYNIPGRTGVMLSVDTTLRMLEKCDNVIAVKDATGGLNYCQELVRRAGDRVSVHMVNLEAGQAIFDATLTLARRPITGGQLARVLLVYPFMTLQVIAGIYWQALRLRWKGTPYHPHPRHAERRDAHTYVPETPR